MRSLAVPTILRIYRSFDSVDSMFLEIPRDVTTLGGPQFKEFPTILEIPRSFESVDALDLSNLSQHREFPRLF